MSSFKLLVVVLNYLNAQVTIDCLRSLSCCPIVTGGNAKVVVWENGSANGSDLILRETIDSNRWGTWIELLISPENLGFTGGNNRVIERVLQSGEAPEYFLLLNSDTLVTDESLTRLIEFMDGHPKAGIAGSKLLTEAGDNQCSPFRFPSIASEFDQGLKLGAVSRLLSRWHVAMPAPARATAVDWVSGASMMLRRQMLENIGLLDEGYFTYFEDVDLCRRAHKAGWEVWYVPESRVVHLEGASSGIAHGIVKRRPAFWFQARRRYFLKHEGALRAAAIDGGYILGFSLWRLRRRLQNKPDKDPQHMLWDSVRESVFLKGFSLPSVSSSTMSSKNANKKESKRRFDILYVEGPGDIVEAFTRWHGEEDVISETSRTYSSQFFDYCRNNHISLYGLSYHSLAKRTERDRFLVENRPKALQGGGVRYHLAQILYGLLIVAKALRYRPHTVNVTSGVTYWFVLAPLKLFGIRVVPHLHNCLWPNGYRPTGLLQRCLLALDGWFFRNIAFAAMCLSPEIERQIGMLAGKKHCPVQQFRGQFYRRDFENPPSPPVENMPFRVVFAGRIERNKGVFDLLDMAERLKGDGVVFDICGGGPVLNELRDEAFRRGLNDCVYIHGNLSRPDLLGVYSNGHAVIVPTRSDFCEGFPKVCAEAVLLGRPVITTRLSNALDVLGGAIVEAQPDDVASFVEAIIKIQNDSAYYASLCRSCESLREPFLDGSCGLTAALQQRMVLSN